MNEIIKKINSRKINIGIIGLGYVGLPLTIRFSEEKFRVVGFDIDEEKVSVRTRNLSTVTDYEFSVSDALCTRLCDHPETRPSRLR